MSFRRLASARSPGPPYRQCEMEVLTPGRYEGEVFVPSTWSRCPNQPAFETGEGRVVCEDCVAWAQGKGAYRFPGGVRRSCGGGDRVDDPVRLGVTLARGVRDRARAAAEEEGLSLTEWVRWAIREGLRGRKLG